jgi:hypothetical protein
VPKLAIEAATTERRVELTHQRGRSRATALTGEKARGRRAATGKIDTEHRGDEVGRSSVQTRGNGGANRMGSRCDLTEIGVGGRLLLAQQI